MLSVERVRQALRNPARALNYLRRRGPGMLELLERGETLKFADRLLARTTGWSAYVSYLQWREGVDLVEREILGTPMLLDLTDRGLSYDLLVFGYRETYSTIVFRRELRRIADRVDRPTVVEVGANIGYYALQEIAILGPDAHLFAFEPVPRNAEILQKNLALNGFADRVDVETTAIGETDGSGELTLRGASNLAHVSGIDGVDDHVPAELSAVGSIDVEMRSLDAYLADRGVDPGAVNVVRMDIEGYELQALEGMREVLAGPPPLVVYVECHPVLWETGAVEDFVSLLEANDLSVISAVYNRTLLDVESLSDLLDAEGHPGLILRKDPPAGSDCDPGPE